MSSSPIKGTLPIAADPDLLRASVKDIAENVMIVDLVRNDLGRVAVPGSVTVPDLLGVYPAPGVWHLVSTVEARVPRGTTTGDLLDASFPPASVTGCPKHRARQLLSQWEPSPRGVYCGTVGLAAPGAGRAERRHPHRRVRPARRRHSSASAAASPPTRIRTPNGRSAWTRRAATIGLSSCADGGRSGPRQARSSPAMSCFRP